MRLPLFPLDTVLFPGCALELQIFEARYLDMVSQCLKAGHGFGVVHILDGREVGAAPTAFASTMAALVATSPWLASRGGSTATRV